MEKKKIIVLVLSVILVMSMYMTYRTYENKPKELPEEKEKIETKKKQFAMYIKDGDNYVEYHGEEGKENLFPEGYKLNEEQSRCEDINGNKIDDISFDTDTNSITVTSNKTSYCYLYFDKQMSVNDLRKYDKTNTLSDNLIGGMYRYQGNSVDNYICLEKVGLAGCSNAQSTGYDDNMYRIIGITPEGNIKVMKQTKYNKNGTSTYAWNKDPHDDKCGSNGCPEWPESDLFRALNTNDDSFLSNLSSDIKDKIEDWEWYYGDIEYTFATDLTEEKLYQIETGEENSQYYPKKQTGNIETGRWQKMNSTAKIGLIYLHDYYYQSTTSTNCHQKSSTGTECKDGGWMHITKNGGSSADQEWTMSRLGRLESSSKYIQAWRVTNSGYIDYNNLDSKLAVRPVFYLKSDIELGGAGTTQNPFYIVK